MASKTYMLKLTAQEFTDLSEILDNLEKSLFVIGSGEALRKTKAINKKIRALKD